MVVFKDPFKLESIQKYTDVISETSVVDAYETIAKSLQPYATKNPKSLTYIIRFIPTTSHAPHSDATFIWIAKDDNLGYHKTFNCTSHRQVIERYYEACVFIDFHCNIHRNPHTPNGVKLDALSSSDISMPFVGLGEPIPDYLFDCDSKPQENGEIPRNDSIVTTSFISPVDFECPNADNDLDSTLIESHFPNSKGPVDFGLSDSSSIYSDDNCYGDLDIIDTSVGVTRREVIDYLYPKYVYSYSNDVSFDDDSTNYCRKPVLVDDNGSWHYECPKADKFQNQLVDKIREWGVYKEERKEVMIRQSISYRNHILQSNMQNSINGICPKCSCAIRKSSSFVEYDDASGTAVNIGVSARPIRLNGVKLNGVKLNGKSRASASFGAASTTKDRGVDIKGINDSVKGGSGVTDDLVKGGDTDDMKGEVDDASNDGIKSRRRRSNLSLCEIKCDGRDSGRYVLRKKGLVGISPLEAFDNNWAYEKILKDLKKQTKSERLRASVPQVSGSSPKKRVGRPPKRRRLNPSNGDIGAELNPTKRRGRIPKRFKLQTVEGVSEEPKPSPIHRKRKGRRGRRSASTLTDGSILDVGTAIRSIIGKDIGGVICSSDTPTYKSARDVVNGVTNDTDASTNDTNDTDVITDVTTDITTDITTDVNIDGVDGAKDSTSDAHGTKIGANGKRSSTRVRRPSKLYSDLDSDTAVKPRKPRRAPTLLKEASGDTVTSKNSVESADDISKNVSSGPGGPNGPSGGKRGRGRKRTSNLGKSECRIDSAIPTPFTPFSGFGANYGPIPPTYGAMGGIPDAYGGFTGYSYTGASYGPIGATYSPMGGMPDPYARYAGFGANYGPMATTFNTIGTSYINTCTGQDEVTNIIPRAPISDDIKPFGGLGFLKGESMNGVIPVPNIKYSVSEIHDAPEIKVGDIQLSKCDTAYFNSCGSCESNIIKDGIDEPGILDTLFKRTHRSRKPRSFYDCYIPLDVNE